MGATIGLYGGREDNRYYRLRANAGLEASAGTTLKTGDTVVLGSDVIHSVSNPSREWTAAIHLYGGDYFGTPRNMWPDPGDDPVAFDVDESRQHSTRPPPGTAGCRPGLTGSTRIGTGSTGHRGPAPTAPT